LGWPHDKTPALKTPKMQPFKKKKLVKALSLGPREKMLRKAGFDIETSFPKFKNSFKPTSREPKLSVFPAAKLPPAF
jgi:hypothetical protein